MKLIFSLTFLLVIVSCRQLLEHPVEIIKINPELADSAGLSNIAQSVDNIILETKESSLITHVMEVEMTNRYVFINDGGMRVLQFDSTGKFIKRIGNQGRGPGEYLGITSIAIDSHYNLLFVASFNKILFFDFSGELINEIKQDSFLEYVTTGDEKLWTISTIFGNNVENSGYINITKLIRYSFQGKPLDTIILRKVTLPRLVGTTNVKATYISDLGYIQYLYYPVLLPEPVTRDTLYEVRNRKLIPTIKLDFGDEAETRHGEKQLYIGNIYRSNNYLFAEYTYKRNKKLFCYKWGNDSSQFNVNLGFTDDYLGSGIIQLRPSDLKNGTLYFVIDAIDLVGKVEGISENSNPVIFRVQLKR